MKLPLSHSTEVYLLHVCVHKVGKQSVIQFSSVHKERRERVYVTFSRCTLPGHRFPVHGQSAEACTGSCMECCWQELFCPLSAGSGCRVLPQTTRRTDTATEERTDTKTLAMNDKNNSGVSKWFCWWQLFFHFPQSGNFPQHRKKCEIIHEFIL